MSRDRHRPFPALRPPRPPDALRERTLTRARAEARAAASDPAARAGAHQAERRPLTDLLWESRLLRLAWAVALVTLIGVNLSLARRPAGPPPEGATAATRAPAAGAARSDGEPRTLLTARKEVLGALLGEDPGPEDEPPPTRRPRRTS